MSQYINPNVTLPTRRAMTAFYGQFIINEVQENVEKYEMITEITQGKKMKKVISSKKRTKL